MIRIDPSTDTAFINERPMPANCIVTDDRTFPTDSDSILLFPPYAIRRFRLLCENGWSVSVIFGSLAYCANRDRHMTPEDLSSPDAEIAVIDPDGSLTAWSDGDTVCGWVEPDDILKVWQAVGGFRSDWTCEDVRMLDHDFGGWETTSSTSPTSP